MTKSATVLCIVFILIAANRLRAPIQEVPETSTPAPVQSAKPKSPRERTAAKKLGPSETNSDGARKFDGTWVGTSAKTSRTGGRVSWVLTLIIRNGKTAVKTVDVTYLSNHESPIYGSTYELRTKWLHNSTSLTAEGSSLTVQWSTGQLSDWGPKSVPRNVAQSYGYGSTDLSNAGPCVYTLKENELTRMNDPNPVIYRRMK
jgi:hypothetical protein